jgi:hypothetical protein
MWSTLGRCRAVGTVGPRRNETSSPAGLSSVQVALRPVSADRETRAEPRYPTLRNFRNDRRLSGLGSVYRCGHCVHDTSPT